MTTGAPREQRIAQVFAEFAALSCGEDESAVHLVLAQRCVELLGVASAAVAITDEAGRLQPTVSVVADGTTRPAGRRPDGHDPLPPHSGGRSDQPRQGAAGELWMHARGEVIGVVTVVGRPAEGLDEVTRQVGQALADAGANALLVLRERLRTEQLTDQLQHALTSRVVIEQAVGILAERWQVDVSQAFQHLRKYARNHNLRLRDVAAAVVSRGVDPFAARRREQPSRPR